MDGVSFRHVIKYEVLAVDVDSVCAGKLFDLPGCLL